MFSFYITIRLVEEIVIIREPDLVIMMFLRNAMKFIRIRFLF